MGDGDATVAGVAAGLGLVAGGAVVSPAGELDGDDVVLGEFVLVAGSQATAKAIARVAVSRSVMRVTSFVFGLLISFPRSDKIEKQDDDCPNDN